jgi:hypothetical protein
LSEGGQRWVRLGAAATLVGAFWATASSCGWFLDAPYLMRPIDAPGTFDSARFITAHETALILVATLYLLPAAWLLASALRRLPAPLERIASLVADDERAVPVLAAVVAVAGAAFVGYALIDKTPLLDDERSYLFQAHIFTHGKLTEPGLPAAFRNQMFIIHRHCSRSGCWSARRTSSTRCSLAPPRSPFTRS